MKHFPSLFNRKGNLAQLMGILSDQLLKFNESIEDVRNQRYLDQATWGLKDWEFDLGLVTDSSKSYERRREMVKAKLLGAGTTTPQKIQRTASAFSGGDVEVIDVPGEYRFIIKFVGVLGIPPNMPGLIQMIEEIKPAHLAYEFAYTYTVWSSLKSISYTTAAKKTWNELRTYS